MYNLYFLKFNNYINRIIKKFDTIEEYIPYISGKRENMNFNLNDGVSASTEAINLKTSILDSEDLTKCNYLISEDIDTKELCRWFIMECKKTRGKQYIFILKRDVIADNYDSVLDATSFIYKGYVKYPDPACIIKENLSFNQIKTNEYYLKEEDFPFACLVAYVSKSTSNEETGDLVEFKIDKTVDFERIIYWFGKAILKSLTDENIQTYSAEIDLSNNTLVEKNNDEILETSSINTNKIELLKGCNGIIIKSFTILYRLKYDKISETNYKITFENLSYDPILNLKIRLTPNRISLDDGFFDLLVVPYKDGFIGGKYINKNDLLNIITSMANNSLFYDVQLVPYRPTDVLKYTTENLTYSEGDFEYNYKLLNFYNDYKFSITTSLPVFESESNTNIITNLFWCKTSKREFYISKYNEDINISEKHLLNDNEYKTISNCQTLRLCSPNENSIYEFNAAPNGGIEYYEVDLKYNPYEPYIHISPNYKFLNGTNFNDYRGLICRGNFSLGRSSSAWEEYKVQNKNYQQTFDRQIEKMEKEINFQLSSGIINTISNTVSGVGLGAMTGTGPIGMAIGGTIGAIQGTYNTIEQQVLSRETLQAEKDIFNYNLGSIKARPNTVSNNSVLDNNNKIFPYVEIYDCSIDEKNIFKNIIDYQGMTLNRIGEIRNYLGNKNFIQARLIRIDINEDDHFLQELNFELTKGVYLDGN